MDDALKKATLASLGLLCLPAVLGATVVVPLSDEAMVAQSELIVIGECRETESVWVDGDLVTVATVDVAATLKGDVETTISVTLPGGVDLDRKFPIASIWPGAPTMQPGEEVFLFLDADEGVREMPVVVGFSQGKFSISSDARGRKVVSRDLEAIRLLRAGEAHPGDRRSVGLADFTSRIRALVEGELPDRARVPR